MPVIEQYVPKVIESEEFQNPERKASKKEKEICFLLFLDEEE